MSQRKKASKAHGHRLSRRARQVTLTAGGKAGRAPAKPSRVEFAGRACPDCVTYFVRTRNGAVICEGCRIQKWAANKTKTLARLRAALRADPEAHGLLSEQVLKLAAKRQAAVQRSRRASLSAAERGAAAHEARTVEALLKGGRTRAA
ncbi:hypothetical protein ABZ874_24450 [Streptomyces albidoflavus]|uniref:hypothetical protein n=1 Tax=Streptomyces albidoflavus TaxID=1886 RepID=UPI0033EBAC82